MQNNEPLSLALKNINHRDFALRKSAFEIICRSGEDALPGLIAILYEKDGYRQEIAIAILWEMFREQALTHPDLVPALLSAIRTNFDANPSVVMDGIGLLCDLKDPSTFEHWMDFLDHPEENVREAAVEALGLLGDIRAVPKIILLLKDPDSCVRDRAVFALKLLKDSRAVFALTEILSDRSIACSGKEHNVTMAEFAASALQEIGTDEALSAVNAWKNYNQ